MSATYPTLVLLAFRSGGICAFSGCGKELTYEAILGSDTYTGRAAHISRAAHIRGEKPTAARYDPAMTDEERDAVENLIYIPGSPSEGISKMKIFCYDLTLAAFSRDLSLGIDMLVHDSTIFDGVDPKQRGTQLSWPLLKLRSIGFSTS